MVFLHLLLFPYLRLLRISIISDKNLIAANTNRIVIHCNHLLQLQKALEDAKEQLAESEEYATSLEQSLKSCKMTSVPESSSNLKNCFDLVIEVSRKLLPTWASANFSVREKLQKMIFPDGIAYHFKTGAFRTITVNKWFELIPQLAKISEDDKKNKGSISAALSSLVGMTRFELATPRPPDVCATGLRYIPILRDCKCKG